MLRTLLPKAKDSNATVASNVLTCLGELVCIAAEDASPCVPDLMRVIMDRLSDPSLAKRSDATLHTLGQLCSNTGYVIQPLVDYPQLLPMLLRILRNESTNFAKREVVKVLGIVGAIDPFRRKVCSAAVCLFVRKIYCFAFYRVRRGKFWMRHRRSPELPRRIPLLLLLLLVPRAL